jgi:hypothetical protein
VPVTNVSVRHVKMKVYNLQVEGLGNNAVGQSGILVQNTSGTPIPQGRWQWTPSRATPQPPRRGGTAPHGDIPELIQHVRQIRGQGATVAEAEQAWVDGMRLIDQWAAQFPGNGPVVNDFFGVVSGDWRVYVGRPPVAGGDAFALAFNTRTGAIAQGRLLNIRPHPTLPNERALFNFSLIYP